MEFYSHWEPKKILLEDHLGKVGRKSFEIIQSKEFNNLDKEILADISHLIGISHDFGKFTSFFQEKLEDIENNIDYIQSIYKSYLEPYKINQEKVFSNLWKYKKDVRESKDIEPLIKEIDKSLFFFRRKANKNVVN